MHSGPVHELASIVSKALVGGNALPTPVVVQGVWDEESRAITIPGGDTIFIGHFQATDFAYNGTLGGFCYLSGINGVAHEISVIPRQLTVFRGFSAPIDFQFVGLALTIPQPTFQ